LRTGARIGTKKHNKVERGITRTTLFTTRPGRELSAHRNLI